MRMQSALYLRLFWFSTALSFGCLPVLLSTPTAEKPQSEATAWIYPVSSSTDQLSQKEAQRFDKSWKDFSLGRTKKAQKDWSSLLKKHPASPRLLTALSYTDLTFQQPNFAIPRLEAALKSDPKYLPALQTLARYFYGQKNFERAFWYTSKLAELLPDDPQVRSDLETLRLIVTDRLLADAHTARAKARWQEAENLYHRAIVAAPELGSLSRELGDVYGYEGKWLEAEASYLKALRLDANDVAAKKRLAEVYLHLNRPDSAQRLLKELSEQNAQDAEIKSMLDNILAHSDPIEEALIVIRQQPQISRGDFAALLGVRFPFLKELAATAPPVILTDLGSHWGKKYLPLIAGLNLVPAFPNHQFRPATLVRRYEVATAIDRLLTLVNRLPKDDPVPQKIVDVPRTNPHYGSIDRIISLRLMTLDNNDRFSPQFGVSGAEALQILDAVGRFLQ
jgi:tetratricopeptide (TPR) repeat protein